MGGILDGFKRLLGFLWTIFSAVVVLVYLVIARSFLFLTMILVCLYFASGSTAMREGVELAVSKSIPGTLEVAAIQWGPMPGSLRVVGLRVKAPNDTEVIHVPSLEVDVDVLATGVGLVRWAMNDDVPMAIGIRRVHLQEPTVQSAPGADGRSTLAWAFSDGKKRPKKPRGAAMDIRLRVLSIFDADLAFRTDTSEIQIEDLGLGAEIGLHPDGEVRVRMPNARVGQLDMVLPESVGTNERGEALRIRAVDTRLQRVLWRNGKLELNVLAPDLAGGKLSLRGEVEPGGPNAGWATELDLELPAESSLLSALSQGAAHGPIRLRIQGGGGFEEVFTEVQVTSPSLNVKGVQLSQFDARLAVEPHITRDGLRTHRVRIPTFKTLALGGSITLEAGRFDPVTTRDEASGSPSGVDTFFTGRLRLDGVNPYALASAPELGSALAALPGLDGTLNLDMGIAAGRRRFDGGWFGAVDLPKLELGWKGLPRVPLAEEVTLHGRLGFEQRLLPDGDFGLDLALEGLDLKSGADRVQLEGTASLPKGELDLSLDLVSGRLGATLGPLGVDHVRGRLRLERFQITGTVESPDVVGTIRLRDSRVNKLALGRLDASIRLKDGELGLHRVKLAAPWGKASLDGSVTLWGSGWRDPSSRMPFLVRRLKADRIVVDKLIQGGGISTEVSLHLDKLRGRLSDPLRSLRGTGRLRTSAVRAGGERLRQVRATLRGDRSEVALDDVIVTLDGGQTITASAALNKRSREVKLHLEADSLPFDAIGAIARGAVPLKGRVSTELHVEGTLEDPMIIGTVGLENFAYGGVVLGDGVLNFTTGEEGIIDISASENFEDLEILDGSHMKLRKGSPEVVLLKIGAHNADVFSVLPGIRVPDTTLRLTGLVDVELRPGDPDQVYQLRVDAAPGGLKLGLYDGEVRLENLAPAYIIHDTLALTIEQTTLGRGAKESLSLCGQLQSDGGLDFQVGGDLDLEILHALRGSFSNLSGSLVIADDPDTGHAIGANRCLAVKGDRLLWLHGSTSDLKWSGRLRSRRVSMTPRGFGREIQLTDGSSIELRTGKKPGELHVVLPDNLPYRFRGQLESGGLELSGSVVLQNMKPETIDLKLVGTDLFFSSPGQFNLTFNPELHLSAEHFGDEKLRSVKLSGPVLITEGLFYKNFDRIAQALGAVGGASGPSSTYSQPITERLPWIKDIALDLQVETPDFRIRSAFPMGQADLDARFDLRVGGTVGNLQLYNRVKILPGGQVLYKVIRRDFEIVNGTIDFSGNPSRPRLDIEAQTEVTYLPASATEEQAQDERQVTVSIRISGVPPGLQIEFWSKDSPNFTDADLQSLILTGRPRDESGSIQDRVGLSVDFGRLVNDIIKSPIVEALNITVGAESVTTRMIYRLGRAVRLKTRVVQEATETRVSAGFTFQLSDALSLEGTLQRTDRSANPTQTYEARFKYRIPLE